MSAKLLRTSLYFTILSMLASAINFAFYPFISHMLSVASFGEVQLGVSFIMLAASLLTSLSTLALFTTAEKSSEKNSLKSIERLIINASIILAVLTIIFAIPLASILQLQEPFLLYILALIFVLNIPASTWVGTLQGGGQFLASGWISVISSITKLLAAYIFISTGIGAYGALLGIALGTFMMLPLAKLFDKSNTIRYSKTFGLFRADDLVFFRKRKDVIAILGSLIVVALIANIDVVVAKIILSPEAAGEYAQISTVAKIPYFACLPVALVLFERFVKKTVPYKKSLLAYVGFAAFVGMGVIVLSDLLLSTLFNYRGNDTSLLSPLVVSFAAYGVLILCVYRLIAIRKVKKLVLLSTVSLATILLLTNQATTASEISYAYMYGTLVALLLSILFTYNVNHD